jgi:hypothetical protein
MWETETATHTHIESKRECEFVNDKVRTREREREWKREREREREKQTDKQKQNLNVIGPKKDWVCEKKKQQHTSTERENKCVCVCMCGWMCVWEREGERERERMLLIVEARCVMRVNGVRSMRQGILKGEGSLYHWPPIWLVWNQLYANWQFLFLFAKQANPNRSNRRSMEVYTSPFSIPCTRWFSCGSCCCSCFTSKIINQTFLLSSSTPSMSSPKNASSVTLRF